MHTTNYSWCVDDVLYRPTDLPGRSENHVRRCQTWEHHHTLPGWRRTPTDDLSMGFQHVQLGVHPAESQHSSSGWFYLPITCFFYYIILLLGQFFFLFVQKSFLGQHFSCLRSKFWFLCFFLRFLRQILSKFWFFRSTF